MNLDPSECLPERLKLTQRMHRLLQPAPEDRAPPPASVGRWEANLDKHHVTGPEGFLQLGQPPALCHLLLPWLTAPPLTPLSPLHSPFQTPSTSLRSKPISVQNGLFSYGNNYCQLKSVLPLLTGVQLCLSLTEGTLLPGRLCISGVCAMLAHSPCSMGICKRNEWTPSVIFTAEPSLRAQSTMRACLTHKPEAPHRSHAGTCVHDFRIPLLATAWADCCPWPDPWTYPDWPLQFFPSGEHMIL